MVLPEPVTVMDECEDVIPESFNFIINSEDPLLNMSRVTPSNSESSSECLRQELEARY